MAHLDDGSAHRLQHFSDNWPAWLSVRHFLNAEMHWELVRAIARSISNSTVTLDDLFDRDRSEGPAYLEGWVAVPRPSSSALEQFLQRIVKLSAWQSDIALDVPTSIETGPLAEVVELLCSMWSLGPVDLEMGRAHPDDLPTPKHTSARILADAIRAAATASDLWDAETARASINQLSVLDTPLRYVAIKHIGDLYADTDAWTLALLCYEAARSLASDDKCPRWDSMARSMVDIATQSIASAKRVISGPGEAAAFLQSEFSTGSHLLQLNGRHDHMVASFATSMDVAFQTADVRPSTLKAPLMHDSVDLESALTQSAAGPARHSEASRHFWAVLRRQTSRGLFEQANLTRAAYATHLLRNLVSIKDAGSNLFEFQLGLRLLIESGHTEYVDQVSWSEKFLSTYLNSTAVEHIVAVSTRHPMAKLQRSKVVVRLFSRWLLVGVSDTTSAGAIATFIAQVARDEIPSNYNNTDLAIQAGKDLLQVVKARPEIKSILSDVALQLVESKLTAASPWLAQQNALDLAVEFADSFSKNQLQRLVAATLALLNLLQPSGGDSLVVRPALNLLVSTPVRQYLRDSAGEEKKVVDLILKFGTENEMGRLGVLFYLRHLRGEALQDSDIQHRVAPVVEKLVGQLSRINWSGLEECIAALLTAPSVARANGISAAIDALIRIISAAGKPANASLTYAYRSVLILSSDRAEIARDAQIDPLELSERLQELSVALLEFWKTVVEKPHLLAEFRIPPKAEPNRVVVYNWTVATLELSKALAGTDAAATLSSALRGATARASLVSPIVQAMNDHRFSSGPSGELKIDDFPTKEIFYRSLGRVVSHYGLLEDNASGDQIGLLIDQCLLYGPRLEDAVVFLAAKRARKSIDRSLTAVRDYRQRLNANDEVRPFVAPSFSDILTDILATSPD